MSRSLGEDMKEIKLKLTTMTKQIKLIQSEKNFMEKKCIDSRKEQK